MLLRAISPYTWIPLLVPYNRPVSKQQVVPILTCLCIYESVQFEYIDEGLDRSSGDVSLISHGVLCCVPKCSGCTQINGGECEVIQVSRDICRLGRRKVILALGNSPKAIKPHDALVRFHFAAGASRATRFTLSTRSLLVYAVESFVSSSLFPSSTSYISISAIIDNGSDVTTVVSYQVKGKTTECQSVFPSHLSPINRRLSTE